MQINNSIVRHSFFLLTGLAILGLFVYLGSPFGIEDLKFSPLPLFFAFIATIGITLSIAVRWGAFANRLANRKLISWGEYYHYFLINRVLGHIFPKDLSDMAGRTLCLKSRDLPLIHSATSVVLDRVFDLLTTGGFLIAAVPFWLKMCSAQQSILLMVCMPLLVLGVLTVNGRVFMMILFNCLNLIIKLLIFIPYFKKIRMGFLSFENIDSRVAVNAFLLSLTKFFFTVLRFVCFSMAMGGNISPELILLGTPLGQITYLVSFTPGGLGIFEAGWFAIFLAGGVEQAIAAQFVVVQRVFSFVFLCMLTVSNYGIIQIRKYWIQD